MGNYTRSSGELKIDKCYDCPFLGNIDDMFFFCDHPAMPTDKPPRDVKNEYQLRTMPSWCELGKRPLVVRKADK